MTEITEVTGGIGGAGTRGGGEGDCPRASTKIQPSATTRTHPVMGVLLQVWSPRVMRALCWQVCPAAARLDRAEHAQAPIAPKRLAEVSLLPYDIGPELDDRHSRATLW